MQIDWIIRDDSHHALLVVALGWGASKEVLGNQRWPEGYDVVTLSDYRDMSFEKEILDLPRYSKRALVAWSFGVWASERLFAEGDFQKLVAIGGTPKPIDRHYGIDPRVFALTLRGVLNDGVVRFVALMCGKHLGDYMKNHSRRSLEDIQEELKILSIQGLIVQENLAWTAAFVPMADRIFPVKAMLDYWTSANVEVRELHGVPHYAFYDKNLIECMIKD